VVENLLGAFMMAHYSATDLPLHKQQMGGVIFETTFFETLMKAIYSGIAYLGPWLS